MKRDTQKIYDFQPGDVQEEQPRRVQQRKKPRKWLWLTLAVVIVLGVVAAAVLWDANSFDGLRRSIIYARAEKDETGCAKLYYYENDATSRFAALNGSLVTVAANQGAGRAQPGAVSEQRPLPAPGSGVRRRRGRGL